MNTLRGEILLLHLAEPGRTHWLLADAQRRQILAHGNLAAEESLSALTPEARHRQVYLLVSSAAIGFHQVTLPGKHNAAALRALPYQLEDRIASEIEQIHVTRLARSGDQIAVALVEHQQMAHWLQQLASADIQPVALLPDVLLLPFTPSRISAVQLDQRWLLRHAHYAGAVAENTWLPILCQGWQLEREQPLLIESYSTPPTQDPVWQAQPPCEPLPLLARQLLEQPQEVLRYNLLHGRYRQRPAKRQQQRLWRLPVCALLCYLLLLFGQQGVTYWQLHRQAAALEQQAMALYQQRYPQQRNTDIRTALRHQLNVSSPRSAGLLPLLQQLIPLQAALQSVRLVRLGYQQQSGELQLQLQADSVQALESLYQQAASHFSVLPMPISENRGQAEATLRLRSL